MKICGSSSVLSITSNNETKTCPTQFLPNRARLHNYLDRSVESAVALAHSLLELIDTSACIYELLLTCVERVALGADVNTQAALRGSCLESLAASALYGDNLCLRMDSFFHVFHLLIKGQARSSKYHVCRTGLYVLGNVTTRNAPRQENSA